MAGFGHLPLSTQVGVLRGLGPARLEALGEAGIATFRDLLWNLPYRYLDRGSVVPLGDLAIRGLGAMPEGRELVTVMGEIRDLRQAPTRIQRMTITEVLLEDASGTLRLVFFNQPYLGRTLKPGDRLLAFGPLSEGRHGWELRSPQVERLGKGENPFVRRFLPLYRKLGPITSRVRSQLVKEALDRAGDAEDFLPRALGKGLPDTLQALRLLHEPPDDCDPGQLEARTTPAHQRLASEELFGFALGVALRREGRLKRKGLRVPTTPALRERLKAYLPFPLTGAQRRAFKEIVDDLTSGQVMHRLLQGDVGSGKT
ncbi:MAG: hypothetical protein JST24_02990, partial [Acidobacteria bacterium]|nr:hypothetical protein [Acidobacteriota bacterium]